MFLLYEEYSEHIHGNQKYEILLAQSVLDIHFLISSAHKGRLLFFLSDICPDRVHDVGGSIWLRIVKLVKTVFELKPELILVNNERSFLVVLLAAIASRIPIIWYIKNFRSSLAIDFICALFAHRILVIAPQCMEKKGVVARIFSKKVHHLPLGIPLETFLELPLPQKKSGLSLLMLSAIAPAKGVHIEIEAMRIIVNKGLYINLFIAGSTPEKHREYAKLVQDKAKGLPITFLGWMEDIPSLIEQADVVILPSYSEGVPRSLVEAMAAGRPVIATKVGGIPHIIDHGRTGLLVDVGDERSLADAIEQLARNPDMREVMGCKARQYAKEHHSFEKHMEMLKRNLFEVIACE